MLVDSKILANVTNMAKFRQIAKCMQPRDYEVREHIPHTWVSSNDSFFQSNFSAWSFCAAILRKTPDWSVVMT